MPRRLDDALPFALVMDCHGAAEGALSVVRTLGRRGVPVAVLADTATALSATSKYCRERHTIESFTQRGATTIDFLIRFAASKPSKPVLFPTADPDLLLVSRWQRELEQHFHLFLTRQDVLEALADKRRFLDLAIEHDFPVPATHSPRGREHLLEIAADVRYPVVLKPSQPAAWTDGRIQAVVHYKKALVLEDRAALVAAYDRIAPYSEDLLVQDYIAGPDDAHYSLHAYMNQRSEPLAVFTGRKVRVYPAHAGSGCYVQSIRVQPMIEAGLEILRTLRYTGIATINFKQDARDGRFVVHEINPRISQWNILPTRCGIDIPFIAYADAAGLEYALPGDQQEGVHYVHFKNDLKAFAAYRRAREWTVTRYIASLLRWPMVHQSLAGDDLRPCVASYLQGLQGGLGRLARLLGRSATATRPSKPELAPLHDAPSTAPHRMPEVVVEPAKHIEGPVGTVRI